jgi:hypothetical protein
MIRFFLEQVVALEVALLVTLGTIIIVVSMGVVVLLRARKSRRDKSAGTA